jgi:hypothetical protein
MMNDVRSGPSCQQYRPRSKQCTEAHIYTNTHRNKIINGRLLNIALIYISRLYCAFSNKKILNIDKYFVCESRDMSDESGTYIILLKLKKHIFLVLILPTKSVFKN